MLIASEIPNECGFDTFTRRFILDWVEASGASQVMMIDSFSQARPSTFYL
ncbi:MAG: hypothetical protein Ct9H90mP23_3140 [Methanobacteriota archaeon]|nr:MAG: hypothetical protein Ct9H90mP23_3140 [Euryarchaeota archaeon]